MAIEPDNLASQSETAIPGNPAHHFVIVIVGYAFIAFTFSLFAIIAANAGSAAGIFSFLSICFAVIQLGAMWAVLGPGKYWKSAALSFLACAMPGLASALGLGLAIGPNLFSEVVLMALYAPILWVMAQLPYFLMRMFFKFQITTFDQPNTPLAISEIFTFTALVAAALAIIRSPIFQATAGARGDDLVGVLVYVGVILAVTFVFSVLPAMLFLLRRDPERIRVELEDPKTIVESDAEKDGAGMSKYLAVVVSGVMLSAIPCSWVAVDLGLIVGWFLALMAFAVGVTIASHKHHGYHLTRGINVPSR